MKSTVVYLHGYGSSPNGDTAEHMKHEFKDHEFIAPHIDHSQDPDKINHQMEKLAGDLHKRDDVVVIGSSAGGFWAHRLAHKHGFKTVLVNPSLHPSENFKKYNLPKEHYAKYKRMEDETKVHPGHHTVVFAGDKDEVVPLHHITNHYKKPIMLKGEGHRLNNMTPVTDMAHSMIGNFPEHH